MSQNQEVLQNNAVGNNERPEQPDGTLSRTEKEQTTGTNNGNNQISRRLAGGLNWRGQANEIATGNGIQIGRWQERVSRCRRRPSKRSRSHNCQHETRLLHEAGCARSRARLFSLASHQN
jgi:hypothetical protein